MRRKLLLTQKDRYAQIVAAEYLAEMVVAFVDSREHVRRIGGEQGDIDCWDDIVMEHHDGSYEHFQVKRQETDFDKSRPVDLSALRSGISQDHTPLDNAIASLASFYQPQNGIIIRPERKFTLAIPDSNFYIKKDLQIRHFMNLCIECQVQGATGASLALRTDKATLDILKWLQTWCGFTDCNHIITVLSRLKIQLCRDENCLYADIRRVLEPHFKTPDDVRDSIIHYIADNTSDIAATTPRLLFNHLRAYLRTDRPTWTQYSFDLTGPKWTVAGLHGQSETHIELPDEIVPELWAHMGRDRKLKITAVWPSIAPKWSLPVALGRLALHLPSAGQALLLGADVWRTGVYQAVAGTLGLEEDSFQNLPWAEHSLPLNPSDVREITGVVGERQEATSLNAEMDEVTWSKVCEKLVGKFIAEIVDVSLLAAVESLWSSWKAELNQNSQRRNEFLAKMLHPLAEGNDVLGELRVGLQTVSLLSDGIFLLLIVAVGLGDENATWEHLGSAGKVRTIGLRRWSGPAGQRRDPRDLEVDGDVLLGKEIADVIILSGVKTSPGEIEKLNLAENVSDKDSLAKSSAPNYLVTNSMNFKLKLRGATLTSLRAFFAAELQRRKTDRENNINRVTGGEDYAI